MYANLNGMGAYDMVDSITLSHRLVAFLPRINVRFSSPPDWPFAKELLTHYYVLKESDYEAITQ